MTLAPLTLLDERPGLPQLDLPEELERLYGGVLAMKSPCVLANFVETIDGVVAMPEVERSNAIIAGESEADHLVASLLERGHDGCAEGAGRPADEG